MNPAPQRRPSASGCPPTSGILLALGIAFATLLIQSHPCLPLKLQWQRGDGLGLTCLASHLCHWSWNHLLWDLFTFGLLSFISLRLMPTRYAACLLSAALLIPLEIHFNQPTLTSYRGLSGLDCSLFGLIVASLWRQTSPASQFLAAIGAIAFLIKTIYEQTAGLTIFVQSSHTSFIPVPSAHLIGFTTGLIMAYSIPKNRCLHIKLEESHCGQAFR